MAPLADGTVATSTNPLEPLAFIASTAMPPRAGTPAGTIDLRTEIRALDGMQKEAVVLQRSPRGATWRLVSDEGPYLNGTDYAPYPLAFFAAGMQFCFLNQLAREAHAAGVGWGSVVVRLDNWYSMTGSALHGDMVGGARPADLLVELGSDAPPDVVARVVSVAAATSPALAVLRDPMNNTFSLVANGREVPLADLRAAPLAGVVDPRDTFDALRPASPPTWWPEIITKLTAAGAVHGVSGGAGTSLQPQQKRILHVHSVGRMIDDARLETEVRLIHPIGSTFRFLGEGWRAEGHADSAPPALAYLAAGIGFCFMTQLGRYAHIVKQRVRAVRAVQDCAFQPRHDGRWTARPVETHVFLDADEPDGAAARLVRMGEQTCFLHAAMRGGFQTRVRATLNGQELPLDSGETGTTD